MQLNYPKVHTDKNKCVFVSFYINNKRYRLYSGKRIGYDINPNYHPLDERFAVGHLLQLKSMITSPKEVNLRPTEAIFYLVVSLQIKSASKEL